MRSTRTVLLAALTLGGATALALWLLHGERSRNPAMAPTVSEPVDRVDTQAGLGQDDREARTRVHLDGAADSPAPVADQAEPSRGETWSLWGVLVELETGVPIAGYQLQFGAGLVSRSDASGRFEVQAPAELFTAGARRAVYVRSPRGEPVSSQIHELRPGMEIAVERLVELRGRVLDPEGRPIQASSVAVAQIRSDLEPLFLGRTLEIDEDGRFVVGARPSRLTGPRLSVEVGHVSTLFPLTCPSDAMRAPEGATLVLDLCSVSFEVRGADGADLNDAELRAVAWRPERARAEVLAFPELDQRGTCEVVLERGLVSVEVCAGATGYAPWIEERDAPPCDGRWVITLVPLGPEDVIEGRVLSADGQPVAEAFASCSLASHDDQWIGVPAIRGVRTDAEGRFRLALLRGQVAQLRAYHHDHGRTADLPVVGGARDLVLRFEPVQRVRIDLQRPGADDRASPARRAMGILALADGEARSEHGWSRGFELEELPPGRHRFVALLEEERLYGLLDFDVFPGLDAELDLQLVPANWARGLIRNSDGTPAAGVRVGRIDRPVPASDEWDFFATTTDSLGAYRLLLGAVGEAEALIEATDGRSLRVYLSADMAGDFSLP